MPISAHPDQAGTDKAPASRLGILLLGETIEADDLAEALKDRAGCHLLRDRDATVAADLATTEVFADTLRTRAIRLVIDATNPYDLAMSDRALTAAVAADRPILRLMRPAWQRDPLDAWIDVTSVAAAADICRWYGKRILLTLGESDLSPFGGNDRCHFIVRLPAKPASPLDLRHHDLIIGQGPFAWIDERRLMMEEKVDLLVSRNIGGLDSYAKVDVARDLAIPVVMISRPVPPFQPSVETVAQALTWIDAWQQSETDQMLISRRTGDQKATSADTE